MGYKHTSLGRPSHATLARRAAFDRQFAESRAWGALIAVHRMLSDKLDKLEAQGWSRAVNPGIWILTDANDNICAEVGISKWFVGYVATVWHLGGYAECGHIKSSRLHAMRWCNERLRAARLNARAAHLERTGAAD